MRFIYLLEWDFVGITGVEKKIESQMKIWEEIGHDVKAVVVGKRNPLVAERYNKTKFDFWLIPNVPILNKLLIDQVIKQFYLILIFFKYFFSKYQFVYYRLSSLSLAFILLLRYRFVLDVNSVDTEAKTGIKATFYFLSKMYLKILFHHAKPAFFITNELKEYYFKKYILQTPFRVLGNGYFNIDIPESELQSYFETKNTNSRPVLLFVGSGNGVQHYWHGYDKFFYLASKLPEFDFVIVGEVFDGEVKSNNVKVIDKILHKEIIQLYRNANIGVGTLALHRKSMNEASPLKVAEYVFFGLPVITAYTDVNIAGMSFNLELPNIEDNITDDAIHAIREFVNKNSHHRLAKSERESVSLFNIESKRMDFIHETLFPQK